MIPTGLHMRWKPGDANLCGLHQSGSDSTAGRLITTGLTSEGMQTYTESYEKKDRWISETGTGLMIHADPSFFVGISLWLAFLCGQS